MSYRNGFLEDSVEKGEVSNYLEKKLKLGIDEINKTLPENNKLKNNVVRVSRVTPELNFIALDVINIEVYGYILNKKGKIERYDICLEIECEFKEDELTNELKRDFDQKISTFLKKVKENIKDLDQFFIGENNKEIKIINEREKLLKKFDEWFEKKDKNNKEKLPKKSKREIN